MSSWPIKQVRELCETFSGGTPLTTRSDYYAGDIPWITSAELNQSHIKSTTGFISELGLHSSSAKLVDPGTPLIAMYGATAGTPAMAEISGAINQAVLALVPKAIDGSFLLHWLSANSGRIVEQFSQGGQPNLSGSAIRALDMPVPPMKEQRAIAEALDDADALIAGLERMIAKKEAVKQGMMQQLLTGRTRLPGFTAPWHTRRLGDHVTYLRSVPLSRAQLDTRSSIKYLHYGDIHTTDAVTLDAAEAEMPRADPSQTATADRLQPGDLVFVDASEDLDGVCKSVEVTAVPPGGVVAGLHTIAGRFSKDTLADGYKAYLQFVPDFRAQVRRIAAGTKVVSVSASRLADVEVPLPTTAAQRAIAAALADADREIQVLRVRLGKARAIKEGMMQLLLTGRVRLPIEEAA